MHSSRNIIKRFALNRCPPPAFGKIKDVAQNGQSSRAPARLANCCRKLYTRLMSSGRGQLAEVRQALGTRRRKYDMTWLKIALRLRKDHTKKPTAFTDTLCVPLRNCLELQPICINSKITTGIIEQDISLQAQPTEIAQQDTCLESTTILQKEPILFAASATEQHASLQKEPTELTATEQHTTLQKELPLFAVTEHTSLQTEPTELTATEQHTGLQPQLGTTATASATLEQHTIQQPLKLAAESPSSLPPELQQDFIKDICNAYFGPTAEPKSCTNKEICDPPEQLKPNDAAEKHTSLTEQLKQSFANFGSKFFHSKNSKDAGTGNPEEPQQQEERPSKVFYCKYVEPTAAELTEKPSPAVQMQHTILRFNKPVRIQGLIIRAKPGFTPSRKS